LFVEMREQFFSPWTQTEPRKATETLEWVFDRYGKGGIFGENLQPRPSSWVEEQRKASRIGAAGELNRFAVSVRQSSLRLMPTEEPAFFSPDLAGEGFPFDYLQNSLVHPGEPLFVSHLSEDGLRAWCDTSYASGWMNLHDLAFVDEKTVKYWMELPLAAVVSENTVFRWGEMSLFRAKTGALFPLVSRGITEHRVLVPFRGLDGHLVVKEVRASSEKVKPVPLPLTPWKLAVVAEEFTGELYGWGGYLGNRDCSAMTRDILLPFGIWLPRNSASQAGIGEVLSLENLSPAEKKDIIKSQGLPFLTLLGMPGHIMLYIGTCKGEPLVLHNMWGVRTERKGVEGRFIVGRCVLSTLDIGSDHPDHVPGRLLIDRLNRMAFPAARH
ncbi:MAG: SH3 domain-containing protein, partial [Synergistaceae bacterium]|nr:SH3 domain-containing protein [Synergistaceae bacterium]